MGQVHKFLQRGFALDALKVEMGLESGLSSLEVRELAQHPFR